MVATVSRKWTLVSDNYSVEIEPGEDVFLILAAVSSSTSALPWLDTESGKYEQGIWVAGKAIRVR